MRECVPGSRLCPCVWHTPRLCQGGTHAEVSVDQRHPTHAIAAVGAAAAAVDVVVVAAVDVDVVGV